VKKIDLLATGLMTFALFLGAGNLIFPPSLGQQAGTALLPAVAGFLITAVGLPAMTLIVLGRLNSSKNLTRTLPPWMAMGFWVLLLTTVGPAFGMPRAVNVAYEMGVKPFLSQDYLLPFSLLFCGLTLLLACKPGRLVDYIGKVMTPILILMLVALALAAIINPLASPMPPTGEYLTRPVISGLIQGYMTMDAIAAVGFGWVIIRTINSKGVSEPAQVARVSVQVAVIYALLMSACYIAMGYVGATSMSVAADASHGGEILTLYVAGEFGVYGQWLLAAIILMACLTTTVGLTNACAEYYQQTFNTPFAITATIVVSLTGIIANFGLEQILSASLPAILVLCPVAIALVMSSLFANAATSRTVVFTAMLLGGVDAVSILDKMPQEVDQVLRQALPLYTAHASWFVPCLLVLIIGKTKQRLTLATS